MNSQNLMVIDPALEVPEIESFNGIVARSPIKATYHLPALHSPDSMHEQIKDTRGIILMGSAASVFEKHEWMNDIEKVINKAVEKQLPILGICLGFQLMTNSSSEGSLEGLGWFDAETIKFDFTKNELKYPLPNIGWRKTNINKNIPLYSGLDDDSKQSYPD